MRTIKQFLVFIFCLSLTFCRDDNGIDNSQNNGNNGGNSTELTQEQKNFIDKIKAKYPTQSINLITDTAISGGPYVKDQKVKITISSSGIAFIDPAPENPSNKEIDLGIFEILEKEYVWKDITNDLKYALSLNTDNSLNEINVNKISNNTFYAQFIEYKSSGGNNGGNNEIANLKLLTDLAGTYTVASVSKGTHNRKTVIIGADGLIDFDNVTKFTADKIKSILDRTNISDEPRIQVSYDANDDGRVINIYLKVGDLKTIDRIVFRYRTNDLENEVKIGTGGNGNMSKPTSTTFKFKATGKDCTPFTQERNKVVALVHINTEKCNGETFRPTLSLNFKFGIDIKPGTYTITEDIPTTDTTVRINSASYNFTNWLATEGTIVVSKNSEDSEKIDIEFKSVKMKNTNPNPNNNKPSDLLTGFIIKV